MDSPNDVVSEGGATSTTSSATADKSMKEETVDSGIEEGETVLVYHGPFLYNAKVQKVEFHMDEWRYHVHYLGWNKQWDEWLGIDRLLKRTDKNLQKQKELKENFEAEKKAKCALLSPDKTNSPIGVVGKKRKHGVLKKDCVIPLEENLISIQIPSTLKKQLVDDYECIRQLGQLVKLPRSPSVYEILDKYLVYRVKKDGVIGDTVTEIVKGLRIYFDKALPAMLLYHNERQQYEAVIANNVSPSSVYGAEHFLRLFVKLPEMLNCMYIEMETATQLQQRLLDILRFLQTNQSTFFLSHYQMSEEVAATVSDEDN